MPRFVWAPVAVTDLAGRGWRRRQLRAGHRFAIATDGEIDEPEPNRPEVAVDRVEVEVDAEVLSR
jgi:hypothetical protein